MSYEKARKRKYNNSTRLNNNARKALKNEKRIAYFADRRFAKEINASMENDLFLAKKKREDFITRVNAA